MSPDDIFAAHMWPWPDPLLKRNPAGAVVFVNAAFLQLYGGRVENWTGHPVQGWPAPNSQGTPYRFETRVPGPSGDIIYDWVEVTMADGNALAIARDVTVFRQEPLIHTPQIEPQLAPPVASPAAQTSPQSAAAFAQMPEEPAYIPPAPVQPALAAPPVTPPPVERMPEEPAASINANIQAPAPVNEAPVPEASTPPAPEVEPVAIVASDAVEDTTLAPDADSQDRVYERRALPIEDGDAVLGSNWRDAVIAKAVGTDLSADTDSDTAEKTPEAPAAPITTPQEDDTAIGQGLKILLAEDNAINALLTRTLLEAEGCTVDTVEDGALAVQAIQSNNYDLIFMDMRMPNMDGLEATRKIRAMGPRTADLPIIALTANAFDDDRNACFDSGMNDFMTKPVSAEELSQMVKTWTAERNTESDAA